MIEKFNTLAAMMMVLFCFVPRAHGEEGRTDLHKLRVMTFNVLYGGTKRGQPLSQTAKVIQLANADVVGLQEVGGNIKNLANLLGWNHSRFGGSGIVTRFEISGRYKDGIKVRLDSGSEAYVFSVHLEPAPYQPYQLLEIPYGNAPFLKTEQEAIAAAKAARESQVVELLTQIAALPQTGLPTFVVGDFNEPSHLDWSEAAAKAGTHPIKVSFPTSRAMAQADFSDAWRTIYPDELQKPGFTWSSATTPDDPKDHHDRIDFVYFKGEGMKVEEVKIVGEDQANADLVVTPYPSDHRAVVATFMDHRSPKVKKGDAKNPDAGTGR